MSVPTAITLLIDVRADEVDHDGSPRRAVAIRDADAAINRRNGRGTNTVAGSDQ
jgi:hypothetical protein